MPEPRLKGFLAALDIAAFRDTGDGIFEALDVLPPWWVECSPDVGSSSPVRLGEVFPFVENFLVDAREFWAVSGSGQLRSGPWAQNNVRAEEWNFEAIAVSHSGDRVLMIERLGEEFEVSRAVLQKARERILNIQRLARIERAFWYPGAEGPDASSLPVTTFRLKQDGTCTEYVAGSNEPPGGRQITELVSDEVAARFRAYVSDALESGVARSFDYSVEGPGETSEYEAYLASCGPDEVLVQVRDVTALRRAERDIVETLERVRRHRDEIMLVLNELRLGAVQVALDCKVIFLNDAACGLLGATMEALEGEHLGTHERLSPEHIAKIEAMLTVPREQRLRVPVDWVDREGNRCWVEVDVHDDPGDAGQRILLFYDVSEVAELRQQLVAGNEFGSMVGTSSAMQQVFSLIEDLAAVDATVLIEGETGTGKELVARALHERSARSAGPFIPVNCAGLTESLVASQLFGHRRGSFTGAIRDQEGVFEAAAGGVVFLDEIGDIPPTVQTSLLRVLQEREITRVGENHPRQVDVRFVAATHRNLEEEVREGRFRQDLLYRIRVARIEVPPLRERFQDLPLLVARFLADFRSRTGKPVRGVSRGALRLLTDHLWPGNVRELQAALEFGAIRTRGELVEEDALPPELRPDLRGASSSDDRTLYLEALARARGNRTEAAKLLGVSRATFYRRIAELDLS